MAIGWLEKVGFAKSLPMPLVVGNLKRLELLRNNPELKERLWKNAMQLQNGLKERGFDIFVIALNSVFSLYHFIVAGQHKCCRELGNAVDALFEGPAVASGKISAADAVAARVLARLEEIAPHFLVYAM